MSLFGFHYTANAPAPGPASWAVPIGVITAATIAGLFSLISLIVSKENKVTEFRQAWIDAQRDDLAEVLALSAALEVAPLEKRAENLAAFDRCFARILLRDNPRSSVMREHRWKSGFHWRAPTWDDWRVWYFERPKDRPLPWSEVTQSIGKLRVELSQARIDSRAVQCCKQKIVIRSRKLLKSEWDIVKDGETWFALSRHFMGSFVVTGAVILAFIISAAACFQLFPAQSVRFVAWLRSWF